MLNKLKNSFRDKAKPRRPGLRCGFTLIEIVIVVGLMGILFALLVFSNARLTTTYQLRNDLRQLAATAKQATQLARASLAKTRVSVFKEGDQYAVQIEKQITDVTGSTSWSCHVGSYYPFYRGVDVKFVNISEYYSVNVVSCATGNSISNAWVVDMKASARSVEYAEVEMTAPGNPVWVISASGVKVALKN